MIDNSHLNVTTPNIQPDKIHLHKITLNYIVCIILYYIATCDHVGLIIGLFYDKIKFVVQKLWPALGVIIV